MLEIEKLFPKLINPEIMRLKEGIRGGGDLSRLIGVNGINESNPKPSFNFFVQQLLAPASLAIDKPPFSVTPLIVQHFCPSPKSNL